MIEARTKIQVEFSVDSRHRIINLETEGQTFGRTIDGRLDELPLYLTRSVTISQARSAYSRRCRSLTSADILVEMLRVVILTRMRVLRVIVELSRRVPRGVDPYETWGHVPPSNVLPIFQK